MKANFVAFQKILCLISSLFSGARVWGDKCHQNIQEKSHAQSFGIAYFAWQVNSPPIPFPDYIHCLVKVFNRKNNIKLPVYYTTSSPYAYPYPYLFSATWQNILKKNIVPIQCHMAKYLKQFRNNPNIWAFWGNHVDNGASL